MQYIITKPLMLLPILDTTSFAHKQKSNQFLEERLVSGTILNLPPYKILKKYDME